MRGLRCGGKDPERIKLKKIRDFLNESRSWLCNEDCKKADPQSQLCTMTFLINSAYSVNKSANTNTFINSYVWEPFMAIELTYEKYQNKTWNGLGEKSNKDRIIKNSNCICM